MALTVRTTNDRTREEQQLVEITLARHRARRADIVDAEYREIATHPPAVIEMSEKP